MTPSSAPLAYRVSRTSSQQLPIYAEAKAGGSLRQTRIRHVGGDLDALKKDLESLFGIQERAPGMKRYEGRGAERDWVKANWLTGHVTVKGWRREEIQKFLVGRNF